jgi:hypothetical protein
MDDTLFPADAGYCCHLQIISITAAIRLKANHTEIKLVRRSENADMLDCF